MTNLRIPKLAVAILFFLIAGTSTAGAKEWRGIIPLHSTRADVEKIVGPPISPGSSTYYLPEETLNIDYSRGSCDGNNRWNVPNDTVVSIDVSPRVKPLLKDLNLDISEYEKKLDPHMGDKRHYINSKDGQSLGVDEPSGVVDYFYYYPTAQEEQDPTWRCPEKPKEKIIDKGDFSGEFSDYWADDTKDILEGVEGRAKADPRATIYIVYSGKDDTSGKIRLFAELTKQHMVEQKIKAERIILMDDKVRNKGFVEVWLCPER